MTTLSLAQVEKYVPLAEELGVSEVARSRRGFLSALRKAGSVAALPEEWRRRREAFIARHMAQVDARGEGLWDEDGKPTRRHLALMMWAYSPTKNPTNLLQRADDAVDVLMRDAQRDTLVTDHPEALLRKDVERFVELCLEAMAPLPLELRAEVDAVFVPPGRGVLPMLSLANGWVAVMSTSQRGPFHPSSRTFEALLIVADDHPAFDDLQALAQTRREGLWFYDGRSAEGYERFLYYVDDAYDYGRW